MPETDVPETDDPETDDPKTDDPETDIPETEGRDGHPRDGWHRRVAQTDGPGRKTMDGRALRFYGFSSQGHPSVPLVLTLPVSETDGAETDVPETEEGRRDGCPRDGGRPLEMDVPETEEGRPGRMSPRWMSLRRKVCFFNHYVRFERM